MQSRRLHQLRRRRGAAVVTAGLGLLASLTLLACSSSEPTDPRVPAGRDDTYVFATVTLIDDLDPPCLNPPDCQPEFYDCTDLSPVVFGETWVMFGDIGTSGVTDETSSSRNIAITASDTTDQTGVAIEFTISGMDAPGWDDPNTNIALRGLPRGMDPCTSPSPDVNGVFVDVDALCARISDTMVSESRFGFDPCQPWSIELTSWELDGGGQLQEAVSTGGNDFSPAGIIEGRFSFVGLNDQTTALGPLQARVQVEGCFRVSVPGDERGVPVNPNVTSSLCTP